MRPKRILDAVLLTLLGEGKSLADIARRLNVSRAAVSLRVRSLREAGKVVKGDAWPFDYRVTTPEDWANLTPTIGYGGVKKLPTKSDVKRVLEVHRFGAWFAIKAGTCQGGRTWKMGGGWEARRFKEKEFTIIVYPRKVCVWLKAYRGFSPDEQGARGRGRLFDRAEELAQAEGLELEFACFAGPKEWTTTEAYRGLSKELLAGLGLYDRPRVRVGDCFFKQDSSHPGKVEVLAVEGAPKDATDAYAQRIHLLCRDDAIVDCPARVEAQGKALVEFAEMFKARVAALEHPEGPELPVREKDERGYA